VSLTPKQAQDAEITRVAAIIDHATRRGRLGDLEDAADALVVAARLLQKAARL
jgi:hypothetical protein